jgi:hypothetical protein
VRDSIQVSQTGVGGRLEVDLLASGASLAKARHSPQVQVGRLVRSSLYASTTPFVVPLNVPSSAYLDTMLTKTSRGPWPVWPGSLPPYGQTAGLGGGLQPAGSGHAGRAGC